MADVHRSQSGSIINNFDNPSKEVTNASVLNTSNDPMIPQDISDFDDANIPAAVNEGSVTYLKQIPQKGGDEPRA